MTAIPPEGDRRRVDDPKLAELQEQVAALRAAADRGEDRAALSLLIDALIGSVNNLTGALEQVTELQKGQQQLEKQQADLAAGVVLKEAFEAKWKENAGRLVQIGRTNRRLAVSAFAAAVVLSGSLLGYVVHHQSGVNGTQDDLNGQRVLSCEQKNTGAQVAVGYIRQLIAEEKALPHPDPVFIKMLGGFVEYTQSQIVPCPGASSSPTTIPTPSGSTLF